MLKKVDKRHIYRHASSAAAWLTSPRCTVAYASSNPAPHCNKACTRRAVSQAKMQPHSASSAQLPSPTRQTQRVATNPGMNDWRSYSAVYDCTAMWTAPTCTC
jgi:hypothetical protein